MYVFTLNKFNRIKNSAKLWHFQMPNVTHVMLHITWAWWHRVLNESSHSWQWKLIIGGRSSRINRTRWEFGYEIVSGKMLQMFVTCHIGYSHFVIHVPYSDVEIDCPSSKITIKGIIANIFMTYFKKEACFRCCDISTPAVHFNLKLKMFSLSKL